MPHSPYRITISAPIKDLDSYRQELRQSRARWECDAEDEYEMIEPLLDNGDTLIQQCEFLETKLDFKKDEIKELKSEKSKLTKRADALNNESEAQKKTIEPQITEISVLKNELEKEKARVATGIEKQQLGSTGDGVGIEANSQHANSDIEGAEKPKEGGNDSETVNPRRRGAESGAAVDEKATKKGRTGEE